ncbi:MAG: hypothetical protein ACRESR_07990 [Gammaproteobacteria bacterium]
MFRIICGLAAGGALLFSGFAGAASSAPPAATSAYVSHSVFAKQGAFFHKDRFGNPPPLLRVILNDKPEKSSNFLKQAALQPSVGKASSPTS